MREALVRIARDLRWTWHGGAQALFHDLDPDAWEASGHNPERLLARLPDARLAKVLARDDFADRLAESPRSSPPSGTTTTAGSPTRSSEIAARFQARRLRGSRASGRRVETRNPCSARIGGTYPANGVGCAAVV